LFVPRDAVPPVKVVDLDDGKTVSHVDLPFNWSYAGTTVVWINETEALCLAEQGKFVRRFNYLTGEIADASAIDPSAPGMDFGGPTSMEVAEDGRTAYWITGGGKVGRVSISTLDLDTGASTPPREIGRAHV